MKTNSLLVCFSLSLLLIACRPVIGQTDKIYQNTVTSTNPDTIDLGTLIIFYDDTIGNKTLLQAISSYGASIIYQYTNLHGVAIKIPSNHSLEEAEDFFGKVKGVLSVQRNHITQLDSAPVEKIQ